MDKGLAKWKTTKSLFEWCQFILEGCDQRGTTRVGFGAIVVSGDMGLDIVSMLLLFADDAKLGGCVDSEEEACHLQKDSNRTVQWSHDWQMKFNPDKCVVMNIGSNNKEYRYYIEGRKLRQVNTVKDLGVMLSSDLKVASQCAEAYNTANRTLGMIKRTI